MSNRTLEMNDTLYDYVLKNSLREPEVLKRLREKTTEVGRLAVMQISPEQGQFMALLVELLGAEKIIEIGTFTGYSTLACALALPKDGKIVACDISDEWTSIGKAFWQEAGMANKIDLRLAPAQDTIKSLLEQESQAGQFDMAFIDADKTSYDGYYEGCLKLLRPGGLILIDNVLWSGAVADPNEQDSDTQALRKLNEKLLKDERISLSLLPVGDGLTLARKR